MKYFNLHRWSSKDDHFLLGCEGDEKYPPTDT